MARKSARQKIGEIKFGVTFKAEKEFRNKAGQYITHSEKVKRADRLWKFVIDIKKEFWTYNYPQETKANWPPPPYYERLVGQQVTHTRNLYNSQQLGENWHVGVEYTAGTPTGFVKSEKPDGTPVSYAPYVLGRNTQAWFHQGLWPIFEDVVDEHLKQFEVTLEEEYKTDIQEIVEDL